MQTTTTRSAELKDIPLVKIRMPAHLPRRTLSIDESFVQSMKETQIEPIVVRSLVDGTFELICGLRRYSAAMKAGLSQISCKIVHASDQEACLMMVQENLQRADVAPMELASFIEEMIMKFKYTEEEVAKLLHKDKSTISNRLRVCRDPFLRQQVESGAQTLQNAIELLNLKPSENAGQEKFKEFESFVDKTSGMSLRELREEKNKKKKGESKMAIPTEEQLDDEDYHDSSRSPPEIIAGLHVDGKGRFTFPCLDCGEEFPVSRRMWSDIAGQLASEEKWKVEHPGCKFSRDGRSRV